MQNRRDILKLASAGVASSSLTAAPAIETLANTKYQDIKGFNYVPSYAATIYEAIDRFDEAVWDREFGYSKQFHSNTLRVWCDSLSFHRDEKHFLRCWEKILALGAKHGLKIMVTPANRWVDARWPYGQVDLAVVLKGEAPREFQSYLKTFVGAFRDHPQVLMWDLCNEPFSFPLAADERGLFLSQLKEQELKFWRTAVEAIRAAKPSQPLTCGVIGPANTPDSFHDLLDVIGCHPYGGWWDDAKSFQDQCDYYVRLANRQKKPLLCSETCQGSKENLTRRKIIEVSIRELERRKIGWIAWQLMAGKIVSARWDRFDTNCKPGDDAIMYWVEKDGKVRPGHNEKEWRTW